MATIQEKLIKSQPVVDYKMQQRGNIISVITALFHRYHQKIFFTPEISAVKIKLRQFVRSYGCNSIANMALKLNVKKYFISKI